MANTPNLSKNSMLLTLTFCRQSFIIIAHMFWKGPGSKCSSLYEAVGSQLLTCAAVARVRPRVLHRCCSTNGYGCVPMKLSLWIEKCRFHIIFMCHKIVGFFFPFQNVKNVKLIPSQRTDLCPSPCYFYRYLQK